MQCREQWLMCGCVVGVAALDQYVYAVGGYDSTYQLPTVERYDVQTNQWEFVAQMSRPRSALNIGVISGKIYALGELLHNWFSNVCLV